MADFFDALGQAFSNRISNRLQDVQNTFENPGEAFQNRFNTAMGQPVTTSTNQVATTPPITTTTPSNWQGQTNEFGGMEERPISPEQSAQQAAMAQARPVAQTTPYDMGEMAGVDQAVARQAAMAQQPQAAQARPQPAPQPNLPVMKPAVPDQAAYNASIAQQESGGRQDIGYHDKAKSTAFGPHGLTAAAYQDARKRNPNLPADITQATPAQLNAAQTAYTQQNAGYLQGYGIQPTTNTLSAAHVIGAKGLSDYQTKKDEQGRPYLSPQAQAANGGYDKLAAIVNGRLGGQAAPASGATQQPQAQAQPQPQAQPTGPAAPYDMGDFAGVNQAVAQQAAMAQPQISQAQQDAAVQAEFQRVKDHEDLSSGDPKRLMALTEHPDKAISTAAAGQLADIFKDKKLQDYAKNKVEGMLANGQVPDPKREKGEEGSYVKAYLFARLGLTDLARKEQELINPSKQYDSVTLDGVPYTLISNPTTGQTIGAKQGDKNITDPAILEQLQSGNMNLKKGVHVTKVVSKIDPKTGIEVNEQTLSDGKTRFIQGGKLYTGDVSGLTNTSDYTKQQDARVNAGYNKLKQLTDNPTDQQKYKALRDAGVPQRRIEQEMGLAEGSLEKAGSKLPANAPAATDGQTRQAASERPVQAPGELNKDYKVRLDAFENKTKLQQKDAEAFASTAVRTRSQLEQIKEAVGVVKGGNYFMGPLFSTTGSKVLPGAQEFFASKFGDQTSTDNTRMLRSLITREGLQGIKDSMGPSISNFDVQAWLKSNPVTEQSSPQALQQYFTKLHNTLYELSEQKRKIAVEQGMLEPSFNFSGKIGEGSEANSGVTSSGNKYKRVQ